LNAYGLDEYAYDACRPAPAASCSKTPHQPSSSTASAPSPPGTALAIALLVATITSGGAQGAGGDRAKAKDNKIEFWNDDTMKNVVVAAGPGRVSATIDGTKFNVAQAEFGV
jgi:hypothetical protein